MNRRFHFKKRCSVSLGKSFRVIQRKLHESIIVMKCRTIPSTDVAIFKANTFQFY